MVKAAHLSLGMQRLRKPSGVQQKIQQKQGWTASKSRFKRSKCFQDRWQRHSGRDWEEGKRNDDRALRCASRDGGEIEDPSALTL